MDWDILSVMSWEHFWHSVSIFPLQRNITFKSHGNIAWQILWYFIAWILISLVCNGINGLWMPIAQHFFAPAVYNLLVTFITGGVSMVIYFFVFKIIFPEGEKKGEKVINL